MTPAKPQLFQYKQLTQLVLCVAFLLYGLWSVPLAWFEHDWNMIPGDWGDVRFNNYLLEHGYRCLRGLEDSFWDAPFMYPFANVIAFSDNLLGTMPFYAAFRFAGLDRETSLQCWILVLFILNYLSAYWVLQRWFGNLALSIAGAWVFAFGIILTGHVNHLQVFPRFMVPLVMYGTWQFFKNGKVQMFALLSIGLLYQFYCAVYLGFILFFCQLCLLFAYKIVFGRPDGFRKLRPLFFWGALSVILMLPLMLPYMEISAITGMRTFESLQSTIPRPVSYFFSHPAATTWKGILSDHSQFAFDDWWFHFQFTGALPWLGLLACVVFLFRYKKEVFAKEATALLLALIFSLAFTTQFGNFSLYHLIHAIPGFSSMRSIDRFMVVIVFSFVLVMVAGFVQVFSQIKYGKYLVFLIPLAVVVDNRIEPWELKRIYKQEARDERNAVKEVLENNYDGHSKAVAYMVTNVNMDLPSYHDKLIRDHLSIMTAAQDLGIKVVNAYSGHYPPGYMDFFDYRDEATLHAWLQANQINDADVQRIYAPVGTINQ
ncbi:MAG: hypothetical protein K1X77_02770 [Bacteroidia bacterium]|nr:hypothetical protein [Bacteroidia bacterium]